MPFQPVFFSRERTEPTNMTIVYVVARIYAECRGPVSRDVGGEGLLVPAVGTLVFGGLERAHQRLDETTPEHR